MFQIKAKKCPSYVPEILLGVQTLICGISDAADVWNFQRVTTTLFGLNKIICRKCYSKLKFISEARRLVFSTLFGFQQLC